MMIALGIVVMTNGNTISAKTKASYKKGIVKITGKGKYSSKKFKNSKKVKKVIVGKNVTKIGNNAFIGCKNLKKISFNKKLKTIGEFAFKGTALNHVDIPTSVKKIGDGAFLIESLKEVKMPGNMHWSYSEIENELYFYTVDKVVFKTAANYKTMLGVPARKYVVSSKDKKYTSIDGAIYRNSDYKLMLIPRVKEFTVSDKCQILDLYYINHFRDLSDDDYFETNSELEKITIPASVKKIVYTNTDKFEQYKKQVGNYPYKANFQFEVLNKNLDEASTKCLEKWNADFINIK